MADFFQYFNYHEKFTLYHSSHPDNRLVARRFLLERNRINTYSYSDSSYCFITGDYTESLEDIYRLSHIHGPFYQQGYSLHCSHFCIS